MIKLLITSIYGTVDITEFVPSISLSGDYQQCCRTLEFGILTSPTDKNIPVIQCEVGNAVKFFQGDRVLFSGYVFTRQKSTDSSTIDCIAFDRGIYLKRNEAVYKFSSLTPEAIAKKICSDFGIAVGKLAATNVKVSRNFVGTSLYKMIQTAYSIAAASTGKKYHMRFNDDALEIIEKGITEETLIIACGSNLMSASTTESIENMINQVKIYNSKDVLVGTQSDSEAIKLYGLMQSYMKQPDKEDVTAKAKKMVADNGLTQKITLNNLGNIANLTGGAVVVQEPYKGDYGLFYIDNDVHTWERGQYHNKLVVNFQNIMDEQEAGELVNANGSKTDGTWTYINKPG